ncbi:7-carboxy-7-deazaguanine synthase [archaeon]|nr:MAG: 7-carboxy-7-deazaguanine synthase [archaeon]
MEIEVIELADEIPVSEIFVSLQGEGLNIGVPSIFVRTAGCNLKCIWCDTKYSWNLRDAKFYDPNILLYEVVDLALRRDIENIVFTGGEPLLWWNMGLCEVVLRLLRMGYFVEVETNGTIYPEPLPIEKNLRFNVSFKLSNSGNSYDERIREDVLKRFNGLPDYMRVFKIVVASVGDLYELEDIIYRLRLDRDAFIIMPMYSEKGKLSEYSWLARECIERGFRFINRLHVDLWGAKRGV